MQSEPPSGSIFSVRRLFLGFGVSLSNAQSSGCVSLLFFRSFIHHPSVGRKDIGLFRIAISVVLADSHCSLFCSERQSDALHCEFPLAYTSVTPQPHATQAGETR